MPDPKKFDFKEAVAPKPAPTITESLATPPKSKWEKMDDLLFSKPVTEAPKPKGININPLLDVKLRLQNTTYTKDVAYINGEKKFNLPKVSYGGTDYVSDNGKIYKYEPYTDTQQGLNSSGSVFIPKTKEKNEWREVENQESFNNEIIKAAQEVAPNEKKIIDGVSYKKDEKNNLYKWVGAASGKSTIEPTQTSGAVGFGFSSEKGGSWYPVQAPSQFELTAIKNGGIENTRGDDFHNSVLTNIYKSTARAKAVDEDRFQGFTKGEISTNLDVALLTTDKSKIGSVLDGYLDSRSIVQSFFPKATPQEKVKYAQMMDILQSKGDQIVGEGTFGFSYNLMKAFLKEEAVQKIQKGKAFNVSTELDVFNTSISDEEKDNLKYKFITYLHDYQKSIIDQNYLVDEKNGVYKIANSANEKQRRNNVNAGIVNQYVKNLDKSKKELDLLANQINTSKNPEEQQTLINKYEEQKNKHNSSIEVVKKIQGKIESQALTDEEVGALNIAEGGVQRVAQEYSELKKELKDYAPQRTKLLEEKAKGREKYTRELEDSDWYVKLPLVGKHLVENFYESVIGHTAAIPGSLITMINNYSKEPNTANAADLLGNYFIETNSRLDDQNHNKYDPQYATKGHELLKGTMEVAGGMGQSFGFMAPLVLGAVLAPESGGATLAAIGKTILSKSIQFGIAHTEVFADYYKQAKEQGFSDTNATNFANISASVNATLELLVPTEKIVMVNKELTKALAKGFVQGDKTYLRATIMNAVKTGLGETFEEYSQSLSDYIIQRTYNGHNLSKFELADNVNEIIGGKDSGMAMTALTTFMTTLAMGGMGQYKGYKAITRDQEQVLGTNYGVFKNTLNELFSQGKINLSRYIEANDHIQSGRLVREVLSRKDGKKVVEDLNKLQSDGVITKEEKEGYLDRLTNLNSFIDSVYDQKMVIKDGKVESAKEFLKYISDTSQVIEDFKNYQKEVQSAKPEGGNYIWWAEEAFNFTNIKEVESILAKTPEYLTFLKEIGVDINKPLILNDIKEKADIAFSKYYKEAVDPITSKVEEVENKVKEDEVNSVESLNKLKTEREELLKQLETIEDVDQSISMREQVSELEAKIKDIESKQPKVETDPEEIVHTEQDFRNEDEGVPTEQTEEPSEDNLSFTENPLGEKLKKDKEVKLVELKKAKEEELKKAKKELTVSPKISEQLGNVVSFQGKPYTIKKEGVRYILESENHIVELSANDNTTLDELNIKLDSEREAIKSKYKVEVQSENKVTVNNVSYNINLDSKGNVISLNPTNNPEQEIKNEKLLIAVEVERNKLEFETLIENEISNEEYEEVKKDNFELLFVEGVYTKNFTPTVESGLSKLYEGKELTESEKLAVDLWVTNAIVDVSKLLAKSDNSEIYQNALSNLEIINILLYTGNHEEYKKQQSVTSTSTPNTSKQRVTEVKTEKSKEVTKVNKTTSPEEKVKSNDQILKEKEKEIEDRYNAKVKALEDSYSRLLEEQVKLDQEKKKNTSPVAIKQSANETVATSKPFDKVSVDDIMRGGANIQRWERPHDEQSEDERDVIQIGDRFYNLELDGSLGDEIEKPKDLIATNRGNDTKTSGLEQEYVNTSNIALKFIYSKLTLEQQNEFSKKLSIYLSENGPKLDKILSFSVSDKLARKNRSVINTKRGEPSADGWYSGAGINWLIKYNFLSINDTKLNSLIASPGTTLVGVRKYTDKDVYANIDIDGNPVRMEFPANYYIEVRFNKESGTFEYKDLDIQSLELPEFNRLFTVGVGNSIGYEKYGYDQLQAFKTNNEIIRAFYANITNETRVEDNTVAGLKLTSFVSQFGDFVLPEALGIPLSQVANSPVFDFSNGESTGKLVVIQNTKVGSGTKFKSQNQTQPTIHLDKNPFNKPFTIFFRDTNSRGVEENIGLPAVLRPLREDEFQEFVKKYKARNLQTIESIRDFAVELKGLINMYNDAYKLVIQDVTTEKGEFFVVVKIEDKVKGGEFKEEFSVKDLIKDLNEKDTIQSFLDKINQAIPEGEFKAIREFKPQDVKVSLNKDTYTDEELMDKLLLVHQYPVVNRRIALTKTLNPKVNEVKDDTVQQVELGEEEEDSPYKLADSNYKYIHDIISNEEIEEVKEGLPKEFKVIMENLGKVKDNRVWGKVLGTALFIDSFAPKGTAYHEQFHIVFRNLLTEKEIQYVLKIGRKNLLAQNPNALSKEAIQKFQLERNYNFTNEEAADWIVEEFLADDFSDYRLNKKSIHKERPISIWSRFLKLFDAIKNFFNKNNTPLYDKIIANHFTNSTVKNNRFSTVGLPVYSLIIKGIDDNNLSADKNSKEILSLINGFVAAEIERDLTDKFNLINSKGDNRVHIKRGVGELLPGAIDKAIKNYDLSNPESFNIKELEIAQRDYPAKYALFKEEMDRAFKVLSSKDEDVINTIKDYVLKKSKELNVFEETTELELLEQEEGSRNIWGELADEANTSWSSLSEMVKTFLSSIVIEKVNEIGITVKVPLEGENVYNKTLQLLGDVKKSDIISTLQAFAEKNDNIRAFVRAFESKTGYNEGNKEIFNDYTVNQDPAWIERKAFYNQVLNALAKVKVDHSATIIESFEELRALTEFEKNKGIKSKDNVKFLHSNTNRVEAQIFKNWSINYAINLASQTDKDGWKGKISQNLKTLGLLNKSLTLEGRKEVKRIAASMGIFLELDLIEYIYSDIEIEGIYKPTRNDLQLALYRIYEEGYPSSNPVTKTALMNLARGNYQYTKDVYQTTFKTVDGKTKYPYIYPNFLFTKARSVRKDLGLERDWYANGKVKPGEKGQEVIDRIEELQKDPYWKGNFFLNRDSTEVAKLMSIFQPTMSGELKDKTNTGKEGITFKGSDFKSAIIDQLLKFNNIRNQFREQGGINTIATAKLWTMQLESSQTQYNFDSPVDNLFDKGRLVDGAKEKIWESVVQEIRRLSGQVFIDINTGKISSNPIGKVDIQSINKQKGFAVYGFLNEALSTSLLDVTRDENGVIKTVKIKEGVDLTTPESKKIILSLVTNKLNEEFQTFKDTLIQEGVIDNSWNSKFIKVKKYENKDGLQEGFKSKEDFYGLFFYNQFLSSIAIEQLLIGDHSFNKNAPDYFKRLKSLNAYGVSYEGLKPRAAYTTEAILNKNTPNELNVNDGQNYITPTHALAKQSNSGRIKSIQEFEDWKNLIDGFKDNSDWLDFLKRSKIDLVDGCKTIYYDGIRMIKTSETVLFKNLTSRWNGEEWEAIPGMEYQHNVREFMEKNTIDILISKSASKRIIPKEQIKWDSFKDNKDLPDFSKQEVSDKYLDVLDGAHYRLQVETKSHNYGRVSFPVQLNMLLDTEINKSKETQDLVDRLEEAKNSVLLENFKNALHHFTPKLKKEFPDYEMFINKVRDTVLSTNDNPRFELFLQPDENKDFKYDPNLPVIVQKMENFYLNHMSKGNNFELPGRQLILVSGLGREVMVDEKDKVITQQEYLANPSKYKGIKTRKLNIHKFENGKLRECEVLITKGIARKYNLKVGDALTDDFLRGIGVRIPTQSHHSMVPFKVVDLLPDIMGDSIILPDEITKLAGADFDVDKLFAFMRDVYWKKGKLTFYSNNGTAKERYQEYIQWNKDNNKDFKVGVDTMKEGSGKFQQAERMIVSLKSAIKDYKKELLELDESIEEIYNSDFSNKEYFEVFEMIDNQEKIINKEELAKENISKLERYLKAETKKFSEEIATRLGLRDEAYFEKHPEFKNNGAHINDVISLWGEIIKSPELQTSVETPVSRDIITDQVQPFFTKVLEDSLSKSMPHTINGLREAYKNNTESKKLVAIHANGNSVNAFMSKNRVSLNKPISFNNREHSALGGWDNDFLERDIEILYDKDGEPFFKTNPTDPSTWYKESKPRRIADSFSSYISYATDNAKELDLTKLRHYDFNGSVYGTGISLGFGFMNMAILANTRIIKELANTIKGKRGYFPSVDISEYELIANFREKLAISLEKKEILPLTRSLTTEDLLKSLKKNSPTEQAQLDLAIVDFYLELKTVAEQSIKVSSVLGSYKKVGSDFESYKNIQENKRELLEDQNVFDLKPIWGEKGTDRVIKTLTGNIDKVINISGEIFIAENKLVDSIGNSIFFELRHSVKKNVKDQIKKDFGNFLMFKAYENYIIKEAAKKKVKIKSLSDVYGRLLTADNTELTNMAQDIKDLLAIGSKKFKQNSLINIIKFNEKDVSLSGYDEVKSLVSSSNVEFVERLLNSSKVLLNFSRPEKIDRKEAKMTYRALMRNLFNYELMSEGLSYGFENLSQYLHPEMFLIYSNSVKDFIRAIGNENEESIRKNIDTYFKGSQTIEKLEKEFKELWFENVRSQEHLSVSRHSIQNTNKDYSTVKGSVNPTTKELTFTYQKVLSKEEFKTHIKDKKPFVFKYKENKVNETYDFLPQEYLNLDEGYKDEQTGERVKILKLYKRTSLSDEKVTYERIEPIGNYYLPIYTFTKEFLKTQPVVTKEDGLRRKYKGDALLNEKSQETGEEDSVSESGLPKIVEYDNLDSLDKEIVGINIRSDKSNPNSLGNRLTNPNWYSKGLMDVESVYKANASKIKAPQLNAEDALKYDMNLMYQLQVEKFRKSPELIDEINAQGGVEFLKNSSHIVGVKNSRWEGKGLESNFIKVLVKSYEKVSKELNKITPTNTQENTITEFTPENVTSLKPNEVFVFGSNAEGAHGKGAALLAKQKFGAIQGQSSGLQGNSYAVITKKNWRVEKSSTLPEIGKELQNMLIFAKNNPDKKFIVTKVGSSLAGYTIEEIKSLFEKLKKFIPNNVVLPKEYEVRNTTINNSESITLTDIQELPSCL